MDKRGPEIEPCGTEQSRWSVAVRQMWM